MVMCGGAPARKCHGYRAACPMWLLSIVMQLRCGLMCSLTPNGETDNTSLHGSCPTTKGEKWSATKWIHVGPFGGSSEAARAKW